MKLVLIPGLAADSRIFQAQKEKFPDLLVLDWLSPIRDESLQEYSERLSSQIPETENVVLGGASFGGIVALHAAMTVKPKAVVLIGSIPSPDILPIYIRCFRQFSFLVDFLPIRLLQFCSGIFCVGILKRWFPLAAELVIQFRNAEPQLFCWSIKRILKWKSPVRISCPIYWIHGRTDRVLPVKPDGPDRQVDGGGHVLSLTHAKEVNEFLNWVLVQVDESKIG